MYAFDYDLTSNTEDSIILLYRKDASHDWFEYAYAEKKTVFDGDGTGYFKCDTLLMGQYTFGNGAFLTSTDDKAFKKTSLKISPNPATDICRISTDYLEDKDLRIEILNAEGRKIYQSSMINSSKGYEALADVSVWPSGQYVVNVIDGHQLIGAASFIVTGE